MKDYLGFEIYNFGIFWGRNFWLVFFGRGSFILPVVFWGRFVVKIVMIR